MIDIFINNGVSEKQFAEESYWDGRYNLDKQVEAVERAYKIDGDKLRRDIKILFEGLKQYVFGDVLPFLRKIDKEDLFLISYGEKKIQMKKIKEAGLDGYFNRIVITHDKVDVINNILKKIKNRDDRIYFLDDRNKYIEEVKKLCLK